jgi:hypothetical protein
MDSDSVSYNKINKMHILGPSDYPVRPIPLREKMFHMYTKGYINDNCSFLKW